MTTIPSAAEHLTGWRRKGASAARLRRAYCCWECQRLFRCAPRELRTADEEERPSLMVRRQTPEWRRVRAILGPLGHIEAEACEDCVAEAYGIEDLGGPEPV